MTVRLQHCWQLWLLQLLPDPCRLCRPLHGSIFTSSDSVGPDVRVTDCDSSCLDPKKNPTDPQMIQMIFRYAHCHALQHARRPVASWAPVLVKLPHGCTYQCTRLYSIATIIVTVLCNLKLQPAITIQIPFGRTGAS